MTDQNRIFRISVRGLVEFVLRAGDIESGGQGDVRQAMLEGGRIHRMIQRRQGADYHAEVPLSAEIPMGEYVLLVAGRADGVIERDTEEISDGQMTIADLTARSDARETEEALWKNVPVIDEIKGTWADIHRMEEAKPLHLAQAKCYACFLAREKNLSRVLVRLTYCQMETEEIRYFRYRFTAAELDAFFDDLVERYRRFSDYLFFGRQKKLASIGALQFPFPWRDGQKTLAGYVYRSIAEEKKLFLEAPTGAGKTLAVLFPALKAVGEERADRIFYMTARTTTRTAPEQAFALLRGQGLFFLTVTITAKEKCCVLPHPDCNPASCPRAKGHYDRVNEALIAFLESGEQADRVTLERYADRYGVCPFEYTLDLSLFADGVICDYNYAFDPFVYLKRFFSEGQEGRHLFLIDEAHNLLDRGREMYSAELSDGEINDAARLFAHVPAGTDPEEKSLIKRLAARIARALDAFDLCTAEVTARELRVLPDIDPLVNELNGVQTLLSELLSLDGRERKEEELDFSFRLYRFLAIAELAGDRYVNYGAREGHVCRIRLLCVDPSENLAACMKRALSSVLFSATFLPIQYYKSLLGGESEDYEAYAKTSFSPEQFHVFVASDVTTRYQARGEEQYRRMARYLHETVSARVGKYLVFFPSYRMLQDVLAAYRAQGTADARVVAQEEQMTEEGREEFLSWFRGGTEEDLSDRVCMEIEEAEEESLIGFCVLGGIFGEGIDLRGERLIGVIVVGTGLPQVSGERELLRSFFEEGGRDGFDYAYRFPGMNKVLQALGRLIRTAEDRGVLLLLDDRFLQPGYQRLFPREWKNYKTVTTESVKSELNAFWARISEK